MYIRIFLSPRGEEKENSIMPKEEYPMVLFSLYDR